VAPQRRAPEPELQESPPQCRSDLSADKITWIIETPYTRVILGRHPGRTDDNQKHSSLRNALFDGLAKVASRLNSGDVHEYFLLPEMTHQIVKESTGLALGIVAPIADEDRAQISLHRAAVFSASPRGST